MNNEIIFTREYPYIGRLSAIVTVPSDYKKEEKLPVILFLHGAGERGDSSPEQLGKVKVHGIPKLFAKDNDYKGLRVITVSPQCPENVIWDTLTFQLKDFIDAAVEEFGGDENRIAITGLSMGGFGTWNMITTYPDYFCCAAPVCGGGVPWRASVLKGKKIRCYHSVDDGAVPYECSVLMVRQAKESGADVEFISYTAEGHGCWVKAYETTDLVEWLAGNR